MGGLGRLITITVLPVGEDYTLRKVLCQKFILFINKNPPGWGILQEILLLRRVLILQFMNSIPDLV